MDQGSGVTSTYSSGYVSLGSTADSLGSSLNINYYAHLDGSFANDGTTSTASFARLETNASAYFQITNATTTLTITESSSFSIQGTNLSGPSFAGVGTQLLLEGSPSASIYDELSMGYGDSLINNGGLSTTKLVSVQTPTQSSNSTQYGTSNPIMLDDTGDPVQITLFLSPGYYTLVAQTYIQVEFGQSGSGTYGDPGVTSNADSSAEQDVAGAPEPASLTLFGLGGIGLAVYGSRRWRAQRQL
jgi:hypothetical protein